LEQPAIPCLNGGIFCLKHGGALIGDHFILPTPFWRGSLNKHHGDLDKGGAASRHTISFYPDSGKETHEKQAFLAGKFRNHWRTPLPSQGFTDSKTKSVILGS
jgi:hypothetical protein